VIVLGAQLDVAQAAVS